MSRPDLSELTAFGAIAERRSFRAAARERGVSPSALSHAIRNLELKLNARLFNRTTRSVALTDAGEVLLRRVMPALVDIAEAVKDVASARDHPSGSMRISSAEAAARPLVRHVLPGFLASYPDIHIEIVVDTKLVDIVADGYDAGIRVFDDVPRDMSRSDSVQTYGLPPSLHRNISLAIRRRKNRKTLNAIDAFAFGSQAAPSIDGISNIAAVVSASTPMAR